MTHLERVQAVLQGRTPDRVPVIPQCFMFSAQEYGYNIGQINRNPRLLAEAHAFCQEKYGYDGCVIDIDDASLEVIGHTIINAISTIGGTIGTHVGPGAIAVAFFEK